MYKSLEVYHILPNKTRQLIAEVQDLNAVRYIVETPKYIGTWLTDNRKLLRFGRGEVIIEERIELPRVLRHRVRASGNYASYDLDIIYHESLRSIRIEANLITGFGDGNRKLWETTSFAHLVELVGKDVAYSCYKYHEMLLSQFKLDSVI